MKNEFRKELWKPVVPYHPEPSKVYRKSKPHSFINYQPLSERYQVPGLLPKTSKEEEKPSPW